MAAHKVAARKVECRVAAVPVAVHRPAAPKEANRAVLRVARMRP